MSYLNLLCQGYTIDEVIDLDEGRKRLAYSEPVNGNLNKTFIRRARKFDFDNMDFDNKDDDNVDNDEFDDDGEFEAGDNELSKYLSPDAGGAGYLDTSSAGPATQSAWWIPSARTRLVAQQFGAKFQSPRKELLLKYIVPELAYHAKNADSQESRDLANSELTRLARREAVRVDKHVSRVISKLKPALTDLHNKGYDVNNAIDSGDQRGDDANPNILAHDAFDHGYTGALPSQYGEIVASHFNARNREAGRTSYYSSDDEFEFDHLPYQMRRDAIRARDVLRREAEARRNSANSIPSDGSRSLSFASRTAAEKRAHLASLETDRDFGIKPLFKGQSRLATSKIPLNHLLDWSRSFK